MADYIDRSLIIAAYKKAVKRIIFLDYDGTLVPFSDLPGDSVFGEPVRGMIMKLATDPKNRVYIISGRDKEFLTEQFWRINTGLIAEHGFLKKEINGDWECTVDIDTNWRKDAKALFNKFLLLYPGSFLEEKESSLAYHYRNAARATGYTVMGALRKQFLLIRGKYPGLQLLDGNKVIEIKPGNFNKGQTASAITAGGNFDFILAAGDDQTDESMFSELADGSFTIKIGTQPTRARYCISSQPQFIGFLGGLMQE